jgi:hypothetical protein
MSYNTDQRDTKSWWFFRWFLSCVKAQVSGPGRQEDPIIISNARPFSHCCASLHIPFPNSHHHTCISAGGRKTRVRWDLTLKYLAQDFLTFL